MRLVSRTRVPQATLALLGQFGDRPGAQTMPLKFTPGREVYDPDRRMVVFFARDDDMLLRRRGHPLKVRIQAIARENYRKRL
jgi:hypothetical protein